MTHDMKCWPIHYIEVCAGRKTCEVRLNDRNFQVGDFLCLREWNPVDEKYTGRETVREVTHLLTGPMFGIGAGYVVMSIR